MFYIKFNNCVINLLLKLLICSVCVCVCVAYAVINLNSNNTVFNFYNVDDCTNNEYYDLNYFTCIPCDTFGINLQPSANRFSCVCKSNNFTTVTIIHGKGHNFVLSCTDYCQNKEDSLNNNKQEFLKNLCSNISALNKIQCKYNYINLTKSNHPAKDIEISFINSYFDDHCQLCDFTYNYDYHGYCIAKELIKPYLKFNLYWPTYSGIMDELKFIAFFCISLHNDTACNYLANLCVSSFYSMAKYSPCFSFLQNQANGQKSYTSNDNINKMVAELKPFLFYPKSEDTVRMLSNQISAINYADLSIFNTIQNKDGHLMEWGSFKLWRLNLCYNSNINNEQTLQFAKPFKTIKCFLTIEQIIDLANTRYKSKSYFNLYLKYNQQDREYLHAIPLLIKNLMPQNQMVNVENWLLVKRFQLIELHERFNATIMYHKNPKSIQIKYNNSHYLIKYNSLRYVNNIQMEYIIYDNNSLSIPLIKLNYHQVDFKGNFSLLTLLPFEFSVKYKHFKDIKDNFSNGILLICLLILAVIISLIRSFILRKRYVMLPLKFNENYIRTFMEFFLEIMNYLAIIFIIYFSLNIWLLYLKYYTKNYAEVAKNLTIMSGKNNFLKCCCYVAALLQSFYICIQLYRTSRYNIYLIDWERPLYINAATIINHKKIQNNFETTGTVSIWRSILVINKWIQLSGEKFISFGIQLILLYIIFMIFSTNNVTINLFIITISYIKINMLMYFWKSFILKYLWRYRSIQQQFVDLCSKSNISLFILTDLFHGFYIHGRSSFGFTDTDITTMLTNLIVNVKDQGLAWTGRGLHNDTDQCFIVVPPMNLNRYLHKLHLNGMNAEEINRNSHTSQINRATANTISIFYKNMKRFFYAFIDHGIKDMDFIIKERTFLERLFNCELNQYLTETKGTFYIDDNYSFTQIWLYGNEWRFFWLNISLLLANYLIFNNFVLAIILIYVLNQILQVMYRWAVKYNVCRKIFIDKRLFNLTF